MDGLAERLKIARMRTGMSQKAVAAALKVSHTVISSYELGRYCPSLQTTCRLASFYGVSLDYLVSDGIGSGPSQEELERLPPSVRALTDVETELLYLWTRLDDKGKSRVKEVMVKEVFRVGNESNPTKK